MATLSTTSLNWLAAQWEDVYGTAVLSGIVGDLAHKARGGYHISRQDQPTDNYSVIRTDDKPGNGPNDRAAAIDMTMSTADIIKCHTRLRAFWKATDPRMKYINAWNGWDGQGDAGRYDVVKHTIQTASSDHKWHIHLEIRRKYVNDMTAMKAILSLLKNQSLAAYQASLSPTPTPPAGGTTVTQTELNDIANLVVDRLLANDTIPGYDAEGNKLPEVAGDPAANDLTPRVAFERMNRVANVLGNDPAKLRALRDLPAKVEEVLALLKAQTPPAA